MGKFIDYIVFVVLSSVLVLCFYSAPELIETITRIKTAGAKFYFLLVIITVHLYFVCIAIEWLGFKIIDWLINDDR
ncbi:MAG: hypothetical protein ACRCX2_24675 [Paraclostridium sp.]